LIARERKGYGMRLDGKMGENKSHLHFVGVLFIFISLIFFLMPRSGFTQEIRGETKEVEDKFSSLIENGSKMIRENDFEKVFSTVRELPPEKKLDFRIRVIENFAYLKGYLVIKKHDYGKKWQAYYKAMCYSRDTTATNILIDLLKDSDPYMRAFTARALGYLGDQRALEELKKVAQQDPNGKVRSRAKEAYEQISGGKLPKDPLKKD
jgi:hypothetical protein